MKRLWNSAMIRILGMLGTVCLSLTGLSHAEESVPVAVGDIVFKTDFEGPEAFTGWSGSPKTGPGRQGGTAIYFEQPAENGPGSVCSRYSMPVKGLEGCVLNLSGWIRVEDVSQPPNSWNGVKYMAPINREGGKAYPQARAGHGTFDWTHVIYAVQIPVDTQAWWLHLGLESVTGRVWFDDLEVVVRKLPFRAAAPVTQGPPYRGHDLPRLRGAMVSPSIDETGLQTFGREWNANVIRWQLVHWHPLEKNFDLNAYDRWLLGALDRFDAVLPLCRKYGLLVVLDLHFTPRGGPDSGRGLFNDAECQKHFVDNWRMMAERYRDCEMIWGYDLANEPNEQAVSLEAMDWQALAEAAGKAIREVDTRHAVIVEPPSGGGPDGFTGFNPIAVPDVVYSVHMYLPHAFTHQGVKSEWNNPYTYPGVIGGQEWNRELLVKALKPAIDFQKTFNVHMYVGEFSAIRWAPDNSAYRYLRDCIDIFEEKGWDWTYHAFREWSGWSVEHDENRENKEKATEPTDRQQLIQEWFAKNSKPVWP